VDDPPAGGKVRVSKRSASITASASVNLIALAFLREGNRKHADNLYAFALMYIPGKSLLKPKVSIGG